VVGNYLLLIALQVLGWIKNK